MEDQVVEDSVVEILLVENNPNDLELALHALKQGRLANNIQVARDGVEALDFIFRKGEFANRTEGNPRLILLDLKLPRLDGLEVLKRIRSDPQTRTIPVVILTTSHEEKDITSSYDLGINSYIVKPVDFEQFVEAMQHLGFYWLLLNQPPIY
jgi:two-component system, response regulator